MHRREAARRTATAFTRYGSTRPLGSTQWGCLVALLDHYVYPGVWVWDTHSHMVKVLDSLVKRGLVTVDADKLYRPAQHVKDLFEVSLATIKAGAPE